MSLEVSGSIAVVLEKPVTCVQVVDGIAEKQFDFTLGE